PGARVVVADDSTDLERETTTERDGRFALLALRPGRYTVSIALSGFATQVFSNVSLPLGSSVDLDVRLTLPSIREGVVVRSDTPVLDARRTAIATVVSAPQLAQLPLNVRNFVSLSLITPGVVTDRVPDQGAAAGSG